MNILAVVSAVEAAFTVTEDLVNEFEVIKPYVTQLMHTAEVAYAGSENSGQSKLQAVLSAAKAIAGALGLSWSNGLESAIVSFINVAKAAFNAFAGVVKAVAPNTSNALASASNTVSSIASQASTVLSSTVSGASPA
jgi:phage-related protein